LFVFARNSIITIERTDNYKLTRIIEGTVLQPVTLGRENYIGKGNIVEGCILAGEDQNGNRIELTNYYLVDYNTSSQNKNVDNYFVHGTLIVDKLTNKMAHGSRDYSKKEKGYDNLILTRVYEVLFNRIFLKLLGYESYYTDYSLQNSPLKHISKSAGAV